MLTALLLALATHRVTRLVTTDSFPPVERARTAIVKRYGAGHWLPYLVTCDWCASVWIGGALTLVTALTVGVPAPLLAWAAASSVTGLLTSWTPE